MSDSAGKRLPGDRIEDGECGGTQSGGNAWICCAMKRALNPIEQAAWEKSPEKLEFDRLL
jgi:hypothetical protein